MIPINLQVRNFPNTDTLENYVNKRFRSLEKFSDLVMHVDVHLQEERGQYVGTAIAKLKGKTIRVEARNRDPMSVIDELKDILLREVKREKEKLKRERRRS
ncbi:MAG: ribosome-associated translation inhibitor RaiA [Thermotogae bacterium]|nr:ribosome-associated translation inhibitor RaiA [Thermotogota bacterium]